MRDDVVLLDVGNLMEFADQPFKDIDDDSLSELTESIKMVGVLVPIIVRNIEGNKYKIISRHRRKRACDNSRD